MAKNYGNGFIQGTTGQTYAGGWRIDTSGVVDGGSVVKGGNVGSDSPMTYSYTLADLADDMGESFGSKVIAKVPGGDTTDSVGISGARAGAVVDGVTVLGYNAGATEWVVRGGNVTTTLGGVSNSVLVSAGRGYVGDLDDDATKVGRTKIGDVEVGSGELETFNMFARSSTNIVPGRTKAANAGTSFTFVNPADGTPAVAAEIAPSNSVPGELTYHFGSGARPTTDDYKARDVAE